MHPDYTKRIRFLFAALIRNDKGGVVRFLGWLPDTMITFANSSVMHCHLYAITFTKT